jgi:hypothetical protein
LAGSFAPGAVSRHGNLRYSRLDDARSPSPMLKRLIRHPAAQALLAWLMGYLGLIWSTTRWQLAKAPNTPR